MIIPFAVNYAFIGFAICLFLLGGNIVSTAFILDHYPESEKAFFGYKFNLNRNYIIVLSKNNFLLA